MQRKWGQITVADEAQAQLAAAQAQLDAANTATLQQLEAVHT